MLRRQLVGDLLERTAQAYEVAVAPETRLHQPPAIEVHEIHQVIAHEQNVVRIQVRMAHAEVVEGANAAPDDDPPQNRNAARANHGCERHGIHEPLRDEIRGVSQPVTMIASGNRRRHRQARAVQVIQQLPFAKRASLELTAPDVPIVSDLRDEPATTVVPQDEPFGLAGADEVHGATTLRFTIQLATLLPEGGLEPARRCVAGPGSVI